MRNIINQHNQLFHCVGFGWNHKGSPETPLAPQWGPPAETSPPGADPDMASQQPGTCCQSSGGKRRAQLPAAPPPPPGAQLLLSGIQNLQHAAGDPEMLQSNSSTFLSILTIKINMKLMFLVAALLVHDSALFSL